MFPAEALWGLPLLYAKLQHNDIHSEIGYIRFLLRHPVCQEQNQRRSKAFACDCMLQIVEVRNPVRCAPS